MAICTYINDQDVENWSKVDDKDLNEIFQEVRQLDPNVMISQQVIKSRNGWFSVPKIITLYSIRIRMDYEAQILNFPLPDGLTGLNTSVSREIAMTYLHAYLNGINKGKRLQAIDNSTTTHL